MARMARVVIPNYPHHVTQRGNRRQKIFFAKTITATRLNSFLNLAGGQGRKYGRIALSQTMFTW